LADLSLLESFTENKIVGVEGGFIPTNWGLPSMTIVQLDSHYFLFCYLDVSKV